MKRTKNPYHFSEKYCLRTPILSINFHESIFTQNKPLRNIWENKILKEAIYLASPYVYKKLCNSFVKNINTSSEKRSLSNTLLNYAIRASTRCTPFGLFAGISIGSFNKNSKIELAPIEQHQRITKYDTNYISSLLNSFLTNPVIKNQLLFFPNSTLYKVANQYRYIEYQLEKANKNYSIEAVEHNFYLEKILKEAQTGKTILQLINKIIDNDVSFDNANNFITSLIDNQILVSELELNITGNDCLNLFVNKISSLKRTKQNTSLLTLLQEHLTTIDKKIGNTPTPYKNSFSSIKKIGAPYEEKYIFQTDLFIKTTANSLATTHGYTIKKLLPLLNKLSPLKLNKKLEEFKKSFLERYETRKMPLAQVLDIELGIGYIQHNSISGTTPFLEDVFPQKKTTTEENILWNEIDQIIYQKLLKAENNHQFTIPLTDNDFEHIEANWNDLPDTLSAFTEVLKINNKECLIVHGLSANAGNLLARFSYGDTELLEHLKQITNLEQQLQPDKIIAEITHLPEARTGNILKRPHLRAYEIPYLAKSTLPLSKQISIDDLWISIQNNKIILTSKKLNKEVLPKLTNAHNYELKGLPIYHFLCDLQSQKERLYLGFSWPKITEKHSFLPRVTYKDSILSKAKWHVKEIDIKALMVHFHVEVLLLATIHKWRIRLQMPKYVQLVEQDNTLLIDLEHFKSIQLLLTSVKNKKKCILEEFLFTEETIVNRKNEKFTNECIMTLYNQEKLNQINL